MNETETSQTETKQTKRPKHLNIPIEKIIELRQRGLTQAEISKVLGCDKSNVSQRLKPYIDQLDEIPRYREHEADIITLVRKHILLSITPTDIKKANLAMKVLAYCQLMDKERLINNQSTSNINIHILHKTLDELNQIESDLLKGMKASGQDGKPSRDIIVS